MRRLVIILLLVGLSFAAILVYGLARTDPSARASSDDPGRPLDPGAANDPDKLADWKPPRLAERTEGLQQRFAPALFDKAQLLEPSGGTAALAVPPAPLRQGKPQPRLARVRLEQGSFAHLSTEGGDDRATTCLCAPGAMLEAAVMDACDARFRDRVADRKCPAELDQRTLAISPATVAITARAAQAASARVEVR